MTAPRAPLSDQDLDVALRQWAAGQRAAIGPPPLPLLESRAGSTRQVRSRRWAVPLTAAAAVVLLAVGVAAVPRLVHRSSPVTGQTAVPIKTSTDLRPWVRDAAVTRSVTLDGGALRLDPPQDPNHRSDADATSEQDAIALWRSGPAGLIGGTVGATDVVIARARITLTMPVEPPTRSALRPVHPPVFRDRPGWVVLTAPVSPACGAVEPGPSLGPAPLSLSIPVWLLSSDGTQAVDYTTAGLPACGNIPNRAAASTSASNHQLIVDAGFAERTDLQACAEAGNTTTINGRAETALVTLLATGPCTGGQLPSNWHAGPLLVLRTTGTSGLTYFDGAQQQIP